MASAQHELHGSAGAVATPQGVGRIEADKRLFDLQLTFNLFPALYADRSWLEHIGVPAPEVPMSTFWTRRLSQALLAHWQLDRQFDCDFFDPAKRLALPDARALLRLGGLVGGLLLRERLRRIIHRADLARVQATMGAPAHRFVLLRQDPVPPQLASFEEWDGEWGDGEAWLAWSASLVMAAIPAAAPGVLGRLRFKFPKRSLSAAARLRCTDTQRASLAGLLVTVLIETDTQWAWLFQAGFAESDRASGRGPASC